MQLVHPKTLGLQIVVNAITPRFSSIPPSKKQPGNQEPGWKQPKFPHQRGQREANFYAETEEARKVLKCLAFDEDEGSMKAS